MEGKQEAILAVENPFFIDAEIIDTKDYGDIVFFKTVNNSGPEEFLCITKDGAVYTCYKDKTPTIKGWPNDGMPRTHVFHSNTTITKGIIDILSFLHKNMFLSTRAHGSRGIRPLILFVVELIKKLDYTHHSASMKLNLKRKPKKKSKRRKKTKRR